MTDLQEETEKMETSARSLRALSHYLFDSAGINAE